MDDIKQIQEAFGRNGILVKKFGLTYNANQQSYAVAFARTLFEGNESKKSLPRLAILEGETGTGKTLAYLLPLFLYVARTGKKGCVSTFTIHLQHQILGGRDISIAREVVEDWTGRRLQSAVRLGRKNFFSVPAIERIISAREEEGLEIESYVKLRDVAMTIGDGLISTLSEIMGDDLDPRIQSAIALRPSEPNSFYEEHLDLAFEADILFINHALLCINTITNGGIIPDVGAIVLDEADRFSTAVESIMRVGLPLHDVRTALARAAEISKDEKVLKKIKNSTLLLGKIEKAIKAYEKTGKDEAVLPGSFGSDAELNNFSKGMKDLSGLLSDSGNQDLRELSQEFSGFSGKAKKIIEAFEMEPKDSSTKNSPVILSFSPVRKWPTIGIVNPNPGTLFRFYLKDERGDLALLLTSATLTYQMGQADDSFLSFKYEMGIKMGKEDSGKHFAEDRLSQHPFTTASFGKMSFVLASSKIPRPFMDDDEGERFLNPIWVDAAAKMICAAVKETPEGGTLVLCSSYADGVELSKRLDKMGIQHLLHKKGQRLADVLRPFESGSGNLLLTPGAWEGVSIPGNRIRSLVIPRMPIPPPDGAKAEAERYFFDKEQMFFKSQREAYRKFRQGIGRGIRSPEDIVTVWISDPRFPKEIVSGIEQEHLGGIRGVCSKMSNAIPARFRESLRDARIFLPSGEILAPAKRKWRL